MLVSRVVDGTAVRILSLLTPEDFVPSQENLFTQSQQLAAVAAARAVGLEASVSGRGARVAGIVDHSPASRFLRTGDLIVAVDGRDVRSLDDVRDAVSSVPPGTQVNITVEREGRTLPVRITTGRFRQAGDEIVGIGVLLETADLDVRLPFQVNIRKREIGGPRRGSPMPW